MFTGHYFCFVFCILFCSSAFKQGKERLPLISCYNIYLSDVLCVVPQKESLIGWEMWWCLSQPSPWGFKPSWCRIYFYFFQFCFCTSTNTVAFAVSRLVVWETVNLISIKTPYVKVKKWHLAHTGHFLLPLKKKRRRKKKKFLGPNSTQTLSTSGQPPTFTPCPAMESQITPRLPRICSSHWPSGQWG